MAPDQISCFGEHLSRRYPVQGKPSIYVNANANKSFFLFRSTDTRHRLRGSPIMNWHATLCRRPPLTPPPPRHGTPTASKILVSIRPQPAASSQPAASQPPITHKKQILGNFLTPGTVDPPSRIGRCHIIQGRFTYN